MQYLGGKSTIAKRIAELIEERERDRGLLIEPFCGGGAMTAALAPLFAEVRSYDVHKDLILMWQALREGWQPPDTLTETEYKSLRYGNPSALRAFAGFGASYGGKWFGGFGRRAAREAQPFQESKRTLLKDIELMRNVIFAQSDFSRIEVPGHAVVYADPPYSGTTDYKTVFSPLRFWHFARQWVTAGARVYVSEYRAPDDFVPVWQHTFTGNMKVKDVTETVFMHVSQV